MTRARLVHACRTRPANASRLCARALTLGTLALTLACRGNPAQRRDALATAPAQRLVGVWDATFWLDRPIDIVSGSSSAPRRITGSIGFVGDHIGALSPEELRSPTHLGVYDVDFRPLGFEVRNVDGFPTAVARTIVGLQGDDSVSIVLDPGAAAYPVRMRGTITADSVRGEWTAGQSLNGGGRFLLLRHLPAGGLARNRGAETRADEKQHQ